MLSRRHKEGEKGVTAGLPVRAQVDGERQAVLRVSQVPETAQGRADKHGWWWGNGK